MILDTHRETLLTQAAAQREQALAMLPSVRSRARRLRRVVDWVELISQAPMLSGIAFFISGWLLRKLLLGARRFAAPLAAINFLGRLAQRLRGQLAPAANGRHRA